LSDLYNYLILLMLKLMLGCCPVFAYGTVNTTTAIDHWGQMPTVLNEPESLRAHSVALGESVPAGFEQ
jgi:hypothetical protein